MEWKDQYKHPNWQKKRLEALEAAEFMCESCGDTETQLHVHHRRYIKGRNIWEYDLSELEVLCVGCHEKAHAIKDRFAELLMHEAVYLEQLLGYASGQVLLGAEGDTACMVSSWEEAKGICDAFLIGAHVESVVLDLMGQQGLITVDQLLAYRERAVT